MDNHELGYQRPLPAEIDDPEDLQDAVIRSRIREAPSFRIGKDRYVIWHGILPSRWRSMLFAINSTDDAKQFLTDAEKHGLSTTSERLLGKALPGFNAHLPKNESRAILAEAIVRGELWIMRRNSQAGKGKADPSVFVAINAEFGTAIDFNFLARWEGGQYLHGYVPFARGVVAGNSGVTIATGFDIGQKSSAELKKLNLESDLHSRLSPFAGHRFKDKNREQVIAAIKVLDAAVPVVSKEEADLLDKLVHAEHVSAAIAAWNGDRDISVPAFSRLPVAWQTVIFSRFFHQGKAAHKTAVAKKFWKAATIGHWAEAVDALAHYPVKPAWYKARVKQESDYLKRSPSPPPLNKLSHPKMDLPGRQNSPRSNNQEFPA